MIFIPDHLILDNSAVIGIKFIESMRFPDGEDLTVAKLKDDLFIEVTMCSGREYTVSVRAQFTEDDWRIKDEGIIGGRYSIFDKWKNTLKGR